MQSAFDPQRAILLDEPETRPFTIQEYLPLREGIAQNIVDLHEQFLLATIDDTVVLLPMLAMIYHHVAQGTSAGTHWMAAYCCLCNSGALFDSCIDGTPYTFAAQGYHDVMILIADQETQSFWNHLTGVCVHGTLAGASMKRLNSLMQISAESALVTHPEAQVAIMDSMSGEEVVAAQRWNARYRLPAQPDYGDELMSTARMDDSRLPRHDMGLGIWTAKTQRYYPVSQLYQHQNVIVDQLDGRCIVIIFNETIGLPVAFYYDVERVTFYRDEIILSENARYRNGVLFINGSPAKVERPNHAAIRWYGFSSIFPGCDIFKSNR